MGRITLITTIFVGAATLFAACTRAPYTKRLQFNLVPDSIMNSVGSSAYGDMLGQSSVARGTTNARTLNKVGKRISRSAQKPDYEWRYALLQDDSINAWCLPGGKIGFYSGILPVLQNEAGMAFVMGHEVGHATARHGAERMSQQLTLIGGLVGLEVFLANKSEMTAGQRAAVLGAIGLGAEVGMILPFSRKHESEADVIGLMYMARAGYPPGESIRVWDRMAAASGSGGPAFLSTHPSPERRQENLRDWMPNARKRYKRNALDYDTLTTLWGEGEATDTRSPPSKAGKPRR